MNYPFVDENHRVCTMFSIPVSDLVGIYKSYIGKTPKSFFDCGCATGELLRQAEELGIKAHGIDIKTYPTPVANLKYFTTGKIKIRSILDCSNINADLAYANGTLTYLTEETLPIALSKFSNVKMLIAIHNTDEDIVAARENGDELLRGAPRLIKSNDWWLETFNNYGLNVNFDKKYGCFCVRNR